MRSERKVRDLRSGAKGVLVETRNGWWTVRWESGTQLEYWAPLTRGWLEVIE